MIGIEKKISSIVLIWISDVCFSKVYDRHCVDHLNNILENITLIAALAKCASDPNCGKVYDFTCDYDGQFYLCPKNAIEYFSDKRKLTKPTNQNPTPPKVSSCIFVKESPLGISNIGIILLNLVKYRNIIRNLH